MKVVRRINGKTILHRKGAEISQQCIESMIGYYKEGGNGTKTLTA